jgi:hypothetical protein
MTNTAHFLPVIDMEMGKIRPVSPGRGEKGAILRLSESLTTIFIVILAWGPAVCCGLRLVWPIFACNTGRPRAFSPQVHTR